MAASSANMRSDQDNAEDMMQDLRETVEVLMDCLPIFNDDDRDAQRDLDLVGQSRQVGTAARPERTPHRGFTATSGSIESSYAQQPPTSSSIPCSLKKKHFIVYTRFISLHLCPVSDVLPPRCKQKIPIIFFESKVCSPH